MAKINQVTGQRVDYREGNDNAPPRYSAPNESFKSVLSFYANPNCSKCGGTGYLSVFKSVVGGRCFKCIPDQLWDGLLGTLIATGTDDVNGQRICEIREVSSNFYASAGYIVTPVGLPPTDSPTIFPTVDDAVHFAREVYGI